MSQFTAESSSVQNHLNNIQSVISRMAANSASCKTWCITLVSAVVVFATDKSKPDAMWMALIPLALFFILDAYYLRLERKFRMLYGDFVKKIHNEEIKLTDMFVMTPPNTSNTAVGTAQALASASVWPFYILIAILLVVLHGWIF